MLSQQQPGSGLLLGQPALWLGQEGELLACRHSASRQSGCLGPRKLGRCSSVGRLGWGGVWGDGSRAELPGEERIWVLEFRGPAHSLRLSWAETHPLRPLCLPAALPPSDSALTSGEEYPSGGRARPGRPLLEGASWSTPQPPLQISRGTSLLRPAPNLWGRMWSHVYQG